MTKREQDVYIFITDYHNEHRYSPTIREIAEGIHTASITSVKDILARLKDKGFVTYEPNKARTIVILKEDN